MATGSIRQRLTRRLRSPFFAVLPIPASDMGSLAVWNPSSNVPDLVAMRELSASQGSRDPVKVLLPELRIDGGILLTKPRNTD